MSEDAVEIVSSVGVLDEAVALLREFVHVSGAIRAVGVIDRDVGEGPAVVDCERFAPIEVDLGDRLVQLPHGVDLAVPPPALPQIRQLPPFEVDASSGEVAGVLGGLEHLSEAVGALADLLGGRNVAMAVFETDDPQTPLSITARAGGREPVVIALGDEAFEL